MNDEHSSDSFSTVIKTITDLAGSIAAAVAFLVALFGLGDIPFPRTTSLLTILVTSIVLINWRWGQICRRQKSSRGAAGRQKLSWQKLFQDLFGKTDPDEHVLPLYRRRMEGFALFSVTLFALLWSGFSAPAIFAELTKKAALTCSYTEGRQRLMVMVADLLQTGSQPPLLVADRVYDSLVSDQQGSLYDVCRLRETIQGTAEAREKANAYKADIVIWGRSDVIYEIHLEAPALDRPDRKLSELSSQEAASVRFQLDEPDNIVFVAQYVLSQLFYLNGQVEESQNRLKDMLAKANLDPMGLNHPKDLAEPYFMLGLLYSPGFSDQPNEEHAITAYSKALELDPDLYAARLNRGMLYANSGQVDQAFTDFTFLIVNHTPLEGSAYVDRAPLQGDPEGALDDLNMAIRFDPGEGYFFRGNQYVMMGDYQSAMEDFKKAIENDPASFYNYHMLGQLQLVTGDFASAEETYTRMISCLEDDSRQQVIAELSEGAKNFPTIQPAVDTIIQELQSAELK